MAEIREQRLCIKFCFKWYKTAVETHRMPKEAFGEPALRQAKTFEWFKQFKDVRVSVEDDKNIRDGCNYAHCWKRSRKCMK